VAKHNKRTISTLKILIEKFGDVTLSEALDRESARRSGRRPSWNLHRLVDVYLGVEAAMAAGMDLGQAREAIATFYGVSKNVVAKRHVEACKRFDPGFRGTIAGSVELHLHGRPRLVEFFPNHGHHAAETRSI
jgi:hypothetical protein